MDNLRTIELDNGTTLELECTDKLLQAVRFYFNMHEPAQITDQQLKEFVIRMCTNAVEKAENSTPVQNSITKDVNDIHILDLSRKD
jgi:hypothetical protein